MSNDNIPNKDLIQAVLDGKAVQFKGPVHADWWHTFPSSTVAIRELISPISGIVFRVKPEPVVWYIPVSDKGDLYDPSDDKETAAIRARDANPLMRIEYFITVFMDAAMRKPTGFGQEAP